jgi:cytochrome o ubiquinol oxidase operon protein cyoD
MSTLTSYLTGYILSIAMTLAAFGMLAWHIHTGHVFPTHLMLTVGFITLALLQLLVQLFFFLHVGNGQNKYWNAAALGFTLFIVAVLVGGTLWIMNNLQHDMTIDTFLNGQIQVQNEND